MLLADAGLPSIRLHDLRHTAATLLLTQGVSPRVVMETLGHSQISLTMNTYCHVLPELQRDAAEKMNAVLAYALRARTAGRSAGVGRRRALAGRVTTATVLPVMSKNSTE